MNENFIIEAKFLHKIYKNNTQNGLHVLKGINLTIKKSEILSIVGPSGAGKSTLLHILGGLDEPSEGIVTIDGQNIYRLSDEKRAYIRNTRIGFVFQFYHLLPEFTALENVLMPALIRVQGVPPSPRLRRTGKGSGVQAQKRAEELLDTVGLKERAAHKPNQLSGGELQRVAIARALINDPDIIFCDEPTGNLDSTNGKMVLELIVRLNKEHKKTVAIVTHDEDIANCADRVLKIRDGILEK